MVSNFDEWMFDRTFLHLGNFAWFSRLIVILLPFLIDFFFFYAYYFFQVRIDSSLFLQFISLFKLFISNKFVIAEISCLCKKTQLFKLLYFTMTYCNEKDRVFVFFVCVTIVCIPHDIVPGFCFVLDLFYIHLTCGAVVFLPLWLVVCFILNFVCLFVWWEWLCGRLFKHLLLTYCVAKCESIHECMKYIYFFCYLQLIPLM